jgi:hypothetical protein
VADLALLVVDCLETVEALGTELCAGICRGDVVDELLCLASVVRVWADAVSDTIGTGKDCVSDGACVDCRCCVEKKDEGECNGDDADHFGVNESELNGRTVNESGLTRVGWTARTAFEIQQQRRAYMFLRPAMLRMSRNDPYWLILASSFGISPAMPPSYSCRNRAFIAFDVGSLFRQDFTESGVLVLEMATPSLIADVCYRTKEMLD